VKRKKVSHKPQTYDINELRELAEKLLVAFNEALKGAHAIKIGVRPEHIHLSHEFNSPNKTKEFEVLTGVVELMGTELLLHAEWNGSDMIAKISTGTLVKPHEQVKLTIDKSLIKVFDNNSCETIE
jgi:multiple sugar transport system ATP-binding protein